LFSKPALHDSTRESEFYRATAVIEGFEKIGCDAINVGHYELAAGLPLLLGLTKTTSIPFISANLRDFYTDELLFDPYLMIQRDGLTLGIIGLTDLVPDSVDGVVVDDYVVAGDEYISKLKNQVDMIVLLVNSDRSTYKNLPSVFPDANLIYTSGSTTLTRPMMAQEENGPFVFSCGREGRYLNLVNVSIENKNDLMINKSYFEEKIKYVNRRIDRYIDKDPNTPIETLYADQPSILSAIKDSKKEIKRMQGWLERAENIVEFQNLAMDASIKDDPTMFNFVNQTLEKCSDLKVQ
jgi:2',3'-cyclic-nucleotide 2'-phosphodiesterase (5'-nucleotidase family)